MIKKSKDKILLFLVRNSVPEYFRPVSLNESYHDEDMNLRKIADLSKNKKLEMFLLRLSGNTRFICEVSKIEKFLGEKLSFEKHLRPLYEEGTLYFAIAKNGDFYDSKEYRKAFDKTNGQVEDYKTGISYVAFWYRERNFLDNNRKIEENAREIGLFET